MQIQSDALKPGHPIPQKYTADGANVSPPLSWSGVPDGAKELALVVEDPDAPRPEPFVHWLVYGIPVDAPGLPERAPLQQTALREPRGAAQGKNSFGKIGYGGPAPPPGHGTHRYHFRLYALDAPLELSGTPDKQSLLAAMSGHVMEEADLVGTYQR